MSTSYKKLWKLLIDRDLKKKDLQELAGISNYTVSNKKSLVLCRIWDLHPHISRIPLVYMVQ